MKPPPHTQHMALAVKSMSSIMMKEVQSGYQVFMKCSSSEQSCHIMFLAPSSVLEHGAGGRGGRAGGACGRGGAGGGSGAGGGKELLSRQPEAQQYTWQHSSSSHTLSEHRCGSSKLAAVLEAGHWRLPLSSPWSRQPEDQHCA